MPRRGDRGTPLPAQAFSSAANSSSVTTGTGFTFNVGGDRVLIGLSGSSPSSTSHEQNLNRPRYLILTVPGSWVSLSTASHSRIAGLLNSSSVAARPWLSSQRAKNLMACPYSLRVFGERPSARR
jgi:hypothetical protein